MEVEYSLSKSKSSLYSTSCGIKNCKPNCIQKFANPKVYFFFYCLNSIIQGTYFAYLIGVLSTLEMRYSFDNTISGVILLADNLSPLLLNVILGYFRKFIHRPRFVGCGMMLIVICCILSCFPYFIFGSKIEPATNSSNIEIELCFDKPNEKNCGVDLSLRNYTAIIILFFANFLKGCGSTVNYTVGIPYLDDSVKKKYSPLYFGANFAIKAVGPTLGFMLSAVCLKYYENPFIEPNFDVNDFRWIGAWWIGFLFIGCLLFLTSIPLYFFPNHMPNAPTVYTAESSDNQESIPDSQLSMKRIVKNPILIFHTLSIIFQINGLYGYFVYVPKYMQIQYHNSASSSSFFSGTIALIAKIPSVLVSGIFISKFKPGPKSLTGYILFVHLFSGFIIIFALFMNCQSSLFMRNQPFLYYEDLECNSMCSCNPTNFDPVCDISGKTYFSACSAGCISSESSNKVISFKNCSCLSQSKNFSTKDTQAFKGICSEDCDKFLPYIISITISKTIASTARVGNILVTLRSVDDIDKTLALGVVETFISICATIPYPLLYGYVIDKSCLLWEEKCNYKGSCLLYDKDMFRYYLHGLSITFIFLSTCCDFIVYLLSSRLTLYNDTNNECNQAAELVKININSDD